ncbi:four helix bundle protein [Mangrovibacterium diazotrophicum]|uniref:Four helix bundle protein n=1 Tax=Mangrovibacterium diazotrophicum TaxID=1261403 RepID=A0A419W6Z1_9BACT|nr:four helix bundle protein [Mangrovibacterium diazotrophicum]RKD91237.1 four helix bundle protein [Mangrovibacterium diazotrophicum]
MTPKELEDRLIQFAIGIIKLSEKLDLNIAGRRLADQIVRSGSSVALNYGEAQSAESPRDFVHKMGICLKELRETFINLRIIDGASLCPDTEIIAELLQENNELISIFVKSIETSKKKHSDFNR